MSTEQQRSILLFEPENKGHHLQYLQYLIEDFLSGGFNVSVAYDQRTNKAFERLETAHPGLLAKTRQLNACCGPKDKLKAAFQCLEKSRADELFMCCLDEVASSLLRKAAFGLRPKKGLKGRISGIFIRPRPLDPAEPPSGNMKLKRAGMNRLLKEGWFKDIYLLDEFLTAELQNKSLPARFHFLPDVAEEPAKTISKADARTELDIPADKTVLLHYGTGTRRKGLPLVLQALEKTTDPNPLYLVVAGRQEEPVQALEKMVSENRATLIDRFVTEEESDTLFSASDWILLPYIDHYGASNVLARAALANRPVIASNHHLLGSRVGRYKTGVTFRNNDSSALSKTLSEILDTPAGHFEQGLQTYAKRFKRDEFRRGLLAPAIRKEPAAS